MIEWQVIKVKVWRRQESNSGPLRPVTTDPPTLSSHLAELEFDIAIEDFRF